MEILRGERVDIGTLKTLGFRKVFENKNKEIFKTRCAEITVSKTKSNKPKVLEIIGSIFYTRNSKSFEGGGCDVFREKKLLRYAKILQEPLKA